jgi:hypothetical protein
MLFKKGNRLSCDNFRGISIIDSIAKIYDYVLYNRLSKWFSPDREQAGAQPRRGCLEHIMTLRLLINFCIRRKLKLFIVYVDFSKAYDRVPRNKLIETLKRLGCGSLMLCALVAMYKVTNSVLGTAVITATIGVRQGSPTSCFLFTVFVNTLIRWIKDRCGEDGFLKWLHVLMLMDDTVILATSRERLVHKLGILQEYCVSHGMVINADKTKLMVINGNSVDRECIDLGIYRIHHCDDYVYLGSVFTSDGKVNSALRKHYIGKRRHFHKLVMFLRANRDIPFIAKWKVVTAAFNASILYGCEGWLDANCNIMNSLYIGAVKVLLGVRMTTTNDLCLAELGLPPLHALVKSRIQNFLQKSMQERVDMDDDPLMFALRLTRAGNPKMSNFIDLVLGETDHVGVARNILQASISGSQRTRYITYAQLNPTLMVHNVYKTPVDNVFIPEYYRLYFTRMRLSSHRLRIETGRWSRLPRERRLCQCGGIQDEQHVLCNCVLTQSLRDSYGNVVNYPQILQNAKAVAEFKFVYDVLRFYE